MKNFLRYFSATVAFVLLAAFLVGCSDSQITDQVIRFELDSAPQNVDPQLASSDSELLVVRNTFEGLFRFACDETLQNGVCEKYIVSNNKKKYTFTLREDAVWADETPLTANDFVFGLSRAVSPSTAAPDAKKLFCIKGAKNIFEGSAPASSLGVKALDDRTLEVNLLSPDSDFMSTLASSIAMPCNKTFFEKTGGRYGLSASTILGNGSFSVKAWSESGDGMLLSRSSTYSGDFLARPAAISLQFNSDSSKRIEDIEKNQLDACKIDTQSLQYINGSDIKTTLFDSTCWAIMVNPSAPVLGTEKAANALSLSLNREEYSKNLPSGFYSSNYIVSPDAMVLNQKYRSLASVSVTDPYDPEQAKSDFSEVINNTYSKKLPETTLLYVDLPGMKLTASYLVQAWQQSLGAFINIKGVSLSEMKARVQSGSYQLAIYPINSSDNTAEGILSQFVTDSPSNIYGFRNYEFDNSINRMDYSLDAKERANILSTAENLLLHNKRIIPIASSATCFAFSPALSDVHFDLRQGNIDFYPVGKK